jgi:hypothetical protein
LSALCGISEDSWISVLVVSRLVWNKMVAMFLSSGSGSGR